MNRLLGLSVRIASKDSKAKLQTASSVAPFNCSRTPLESVVWSLGLWTLRKFALFVCTISIADDVEALTEI